MNIKNHHFLYMKGKISTNTNNEELSTKPLVWLICYGRMVKAKTVGFRKESDFMFYMIE